MNLFSAADYFKGALVSKKGLIPNKVADEIFGYERGTCMLTPTVENWIESESAILQGTVA